MGGRHAGARAGEWARCVVGHIASGTRHETPPERGGHAQPTCAVQTHRCRVRVRGWGLGVWRSPMVVVLFCGRWVGARNVGGLSSGFPATRRGAACRDVHASRPLGQPPCVFADAPAGGGWGGRWREECTCMFVAWLCSGAHKARRATSGWAESGFPATRPCAHVTRVTACTPAAVCPCRHTGGWRGGTQVAGKRECIVAFSSF